MACIAVIAGTGFEHLAADESAEVIDLDTPFGKTSAGIRKSRRGEHDVLFLPRHGSDSSIPPHRVNYRANIWSLHKSGADYVLAVNAVGGINPQAAPGMLAFPDQLIDYTWGRAHTFFDGTDDGAPARHVEFTRPYCEEFRQQLLRLAAELKLTYLASATYGATQGPRLETAAEIDRLERDGCTLAGMTGMPEAALARELGLSYASCAVIVNRAAGRGDAGIHAEIEAHLASGMAQTARLFQRLIADI